MCEHVVDVVRILGLVSLVESEGLQEDQDPGRREANRDIVRSAVGKLPTDLDHGGLLAKELGALHATRENITHLLMPVSTTPPVRQGSQKVHPDVDFPTIYEDRA